MVATTLKQREIAIIGYNTEDISNPVGDSITFTILVPIGLGTQIFFTDRAWNGTTFAAAGGGDGTFTYTAGADLPAGTIVTITAAQLSAAGMSLSDAGETIYVYQGAINAPSLFLYAADIADGNTAFEAGELTNTNLSVAAGTATAIAGDNAAYGDRGHNIQLTDLLNAISNPTNWTSDNNTIQTPAAGDFDSAPDQHIWMALPGDAGLFRMARDGADTASHQLALYQWIDNPATYFNHPNEIVFDTVHGLFFVADTDTGNRRILQGNIADLFNPGALPVLTVLYSDPNPATSAGQINGLAIDVGHSATGGALYFVNQGNFNRIIYDHDGTSPTLQAALTLAVLPAGTFANEIAVDIANNRAYVLSTASSTEAISVPPGTPGAIEDPGAPGTYYIVGTNITNNEIWQILGLHRTDNANADVGDPTRLNWVGGDNGGQDLQDAKGLLSSIDIDPNTGLLYFTTVQINNGVAGEVGGIHRYNLATGTYETLYTEGNATDYVFKYIDVDPASGRYYVSNTSFDDGTGANTSSILVHALNAGAPTHFGFTPVMNSAVPWGLTIQNAPTLTGSTPAAAVTEASNLPNSGNTAFVLLFSALTASDIDTVDGTDELAGALVRISNNFQSGATHQDFLTVNNDPDGSGTTASGITFSYNSTTGVLTLSGPATTAEYAAALATVQFYTSGDDITAYGAALTRTVALSVFDGLLYSDEITTVVTVTGINDAPVNANAGADSGAEDTSFNIAGLSVSDVDANPAAAGGQQLTVTLTVTRGVLNLNTGVAGGILAGDIIGGAQGTATITIQASASEINATFANATGVQFTGGTNVNGTVTLTMVTNDQGFNGNDPGISGAGDSEADSDNYTITVTAVNDAPTVGDGTEDAAAINEDTPLTNLTAPTVAALFGGQFSDALDDQTAFPGGSSPNTFAGIAVITNASSGATGQWQYWTGAAWVNIGSPGAGSATFVRGDALIRFEPALNYNGNAPALVAHLVDNSAGSPTVNGAGINLIVTPPGGTSPYSSGTVTLSQAITAVNDAPVNTVPGTLNLSEDAVNVVVAGLSVNDVEAGPAGQPLTVTLSVARGTLTISTAIVGGIDATHVTGGAPGASNQASITITATQAQINATLAGANGLTYTPTSNVNGNDTLTILTSDLGYTGTGGTLTDTDPRTLNVGAVNDAPTVGDGTESATAINEDTPHTSGSAQTVSGLFGPQFSDATDQVAGGSIANGLLGIAIVVNGSNANGAWEWLNGAVWTAIGAASQAAAKTFDAGTQIRFNPATDFNGPAPTLTAHLVDNSSGTITNGGTVNLSAGGATGGTTRYSAGTVVLSQDVNSVNDAPTQSGLSGDLAAWTENGGAVGLDLGGNAAILDVDSADFGGGSLTVLLSGGVVAEDGLFIRAIGNITFDATTVSFNGTEFATYLGGGFGGGNISFSFDTDASLAAVTALVQALAYDNNGGGGEYPTGSTRSVTWTLVDGDGNLNGGNDTLLIGSQVSVAAINDSPVVTAASPLAVDEQVAEAIAPAGTLADADLDARNGGNGDYAGATLTIVRNGGANAQDLLSVVNGAGFVVNAGNLETSPGGLVFATVSGGGASPLVITFTGSGTPATSALADAVLQAVQYVFTGDSPTSPFQLDLTFDDGAPTNAGQGSVAGNPASTTTSIMVNITDTPEQAAPVIAGLNGDVVTSSEGVSPTVLIDDSAVAATVTDSDSPHFNGGNLTVSITVNEVAGEDRLGVQPSATVTLSSGTDLGSVVSVGGLAIGTVTSNGINGNDLVITFNTNDATQANVGLLINAITYTNINAFDPSALARTVSVTVNDGAANSLPAIVTVNIVTQNDPPILDMDGPGGGGTATLNYTENAPVTAIAPLAIRFDDTVNYDDGHLTIEITNGINGEDVLSIISTGTGSGQISYSSGVISYEGTPIADLLPSPLAPFPVLDIDFRAVTISAAAVEALLRAIGYNNTSDNPTVSPARSVTYSLNDGEGDANGGGHTGTQTATINITATNDAASITGTATGDVTEAGGVDNGTPGTPSDSGNLDSTDVDGTADAWQVIAPGAASIGGYGTYGVDAAGVWTYTLNDNHASVQALFGAATLTDTFNAVTADGTAQLVTITINAQDDAPTAQPDAVSTPETTAVSGDLFDDNGSGPDTDPDSGGAITISAVNGSGAAVNNMIVLASGAQLTVNDDGTFTYNPNNAFNTTPTAGSGASNTPAPDSFTYTLTGGGTTMVSVTVTGVDSNDFLFGTGGADALTGGIGNDFYFVDQAADTVNEVAGQGFDVVWTTVSYILAAGTDVEALSTRLWEGTGAINLTGNEIANNLYGNAGANALDGGGSSDVLFGFGGNDSLTGGTGTDVMYGGAGDDFYFIDNSGDSAIEAASEGYDVAWTTASYVLAAGIEIEVLSARFWEDTTAIDLAGNALDNVLVGNEGINNLSGMGGNDILDGMGGNDTLLGGAGNDRLQGGTGADAMFGGANDDFYFVDNSGDTAIETAGQGFDVVWTSVSYALAAGSEIEALSAISWEATDALTLVGNDLGNALYGNAGSNVLNGRGGNDTLVGFGGADSFLFDSALGGNVDTIADFSGPNDTIVLDDSIFAALSTGTLNANAFVIGTAALDADDRIIYDMATGALYYDADGSGGGAAVQFAILQAAPPINSSDFTVI